MVTWADGAEPLSPEQLLALYRGALSLESRVQRLRVATLVLLTGRLGLSVDEAVHCHEGWIDWTDGTIEIPEKDPCACDTCWDVARDRRDYSEPVVEVLYEECWSPPAERRARTVPFAWSPRCRAALAAAYDRWDVIESDPDGVRQRLEAAERKADIETTVSPDMLALSAAQTFRALGLGPDPVARILGVDGRPIVIGTDGADPTDALDRLAGQRAPADSFPVACGTGQLPGEPIDPAGEPVMDGSAVDDSDGVPLEPSVPDAVDYDAGDHAAAGGPTRRSDARSAADAGPRQRSPNAGGQQVSTDGPSARHGPNALGESDGTVAAIVAIESQCTPDRTMAVRSVCESFQLLL